MSRSSRGASRRAVRVPILVILLAGAAYAHAQTTPDAGVATPGTRAVTDAASGAVTETDAATEPGDATDAGTATNAAAATGTAAGTATGTAPVPESGAVWVAPDAEPEPRAGADRNTGIEGRIVDAKTGQPLEGAVVLIQAREGTRTAITDARGHYVAHVPPGTYTVRSYYELFHAARIGRIRVVRGSLADVNLLLDPIDEEGEVTVVEMEIPYRADTTSAAAQDQLRQASIGIGEGMGAQQMSKSGAGDAESAAKRVVGVTIDSNQLVIRGLGGRYTRVLLNGDPVPSTDPDRPGVDLDLFPTSVIDSLTVSKVFLPHLPGDFAGGVLEINTISYPREFTLEAGASAGFNSQSTFQDRLDYRGGRYDFLGIDDGRRSIPDSVPDDEALELSSTRPGSRNRGSFTEREQIYPIAEDFRNVWQYRPTTAFPKVGLDAAIGDAVDLPGQKRFGYMVAAGYEHNDKRQTGLSRKLNIALDETDFYDTEKGTEEVLLSTLGTASLDLGIDHSVTLLSMLNRSMEDDTSFQTGRSALVPTDKWELAFVARTLWLNQLRGDHRNLGGSRLRLRWTGFFALGERDEPDRRSIVYGEQIPGMPYHWNTKSGSGERFFSNLGQTDVGGSTSLRFPLWPEGWGTVGGATRYSVRGFEIRRFLMQREMVTNQNLFAAPPEELFSEEGIGTLTTAEEQTEPFDSYDADQTLFAGFTEIETPLVGPLSTAGGARVEVFEQNLLAKEPFEDATDVEHTPENSIDRTDVDVLPGAALKYALTDKMFVRSAYSLTLGRAQIRELAPYRYYDFVRDRYIVGNPALVQTKIHNVDLRWEWFFAEAQVLAVSGFYKRFIDPIELQVQSTNLDSQYVNAEGATSLGSEIELRVGLEHLTWALERFEIEANLALIHSRVDLPSDSVTVRPERPMFGQAPYVLNAGVHYDDPGTHLRAGVVYNVVGPRIIDVGVLTQEGFFPDTIEQPFHSFDFVSSWRFTDHFKLKLKLKNFLFQKTRHEQGGVLVRGIDKGADASVGLSYEH